MDYIFIDIPLSNIILFLWPNSNGENRFLEIILTPPWGVWYNGQKPGTAPVGAGINPARKGSPVKGSWHGEAMTEGL